MFEEAWCSRCAHSDHRAGKEIGDRDNPPCPVWMAHSLYAYQLGGEKSKDDPGKVILDMLLSHEMVTASDGHGIPENECKMFHPVDAGAAIPGQLRLDE